MKEVLDWAIKLAGIIALAYLILLIFVYFWQRKLLYYPDSERADAAELQQAQLQEWPPDPEQPFRGLLGGQLTSPKGTVLVFHGNAGAAWHRFYYSHALGKLGYRVILAEYPGYGGRPGSPSESTLVNDAVASLDLALQRFPEPVYVWGESLGAGVAAALVQQRPDHIKGTILLTPWDTLPDLASHYYPYLPVKWLIRDHYPSTLNLQGYSGRIALIIAAQDEIIPVNHSMTLFDSISTEKQLWQFPDAGHNSWPFNADEPWWSDVMQFVSE
ncbi:alpha/beta fold family hydrolase [Oleiphilus messinensis]|uniref:Alpha/beta fold family hydrolase n=1 Tax=Oleiphilus messinensis TaxID=141451 RepID=A0A1Y0IGS0_9GAMM|nr:alpha/beta fold hydrolase [Oleiphilus messinensis]ARU59329.1 alpha/beta fold family hydrolase [Oleiphilus messinensis]